MSTSTTISLQLPDLLSYCSPFDLRTNKHCRSTSLASEKWLLDAGIAFPSLAWNAVKPGLLAAACHPCADATQLRFVADVLGIVLFDRECARDGGQEGGTTTSDPFMLLSDRLSRIAYKHPGWYLRFVKSQRCYLEARRQLAMHAVQGVLPDLESFLEQRRDASGLRIALDLVQYAGEMDLSETLRGGALFERLYDHACDIGAWSEDIISCAKGFPSVSDTTTTYAHINLVTVLMRERNVPLECAVSMAGTLVKQSVDAFLATEEALFSVPEFAADDEVRRYVRGLRDWIAGFVNWLYETRLYLGEKGNEVRAFGWVFVPVLP